MAKIKITQTVSRIGSTERQKRNLDALGIKKMHRTVIHEDSPIILGMVEKVKHLVKVEAATEAEAPKKAAAPKKTAEAPKAPKAAPKKAAPAAEVEPVKEA
jgi:large subunit ribosomal protein L30